MVSIIEVITIKLNEIFKTKNNILTIFPFLKSFCALEKINYNEFNILLFDPDFHIERKKQFNGFPINLKSISINNLILLIFKDPKIRKRCISILNDQLEIIWSNNIESQYSSKFEPMINKNIISIPEEIAHRIMRLEFKENEGIIQNNIPWNKSIIFWPIPAEEGNIAVITPNIGWGITSKGIIFKITSSGQEIWKKDINYRKISSLDGYLVLIAYPMSINGKTQVMALDINGNIKNKTELDGIQLISLLPSFDLEYVTCTIPQIKSFGTKTNIFIIDRKFDIITQQIPIWIKQSIFLPHLSKLIFNNTRQILYCSIIK